MHFHSFTSKVILQNVIIPAPHPRKLKEDYAVNLLIIFTLQKVTQYVFDRLNFFLS